MGNKSIAAKLLNILYPPRCEWCGEVSGGQICAGCKKQLWPLALAPTPLNEYQSVAGFTVYASFSYKDLVQSTVHRFKFDGEEWLAKPLASYMHATLAATGFTPDILVPVAMHKTNERERGYNQCALMAGELSGLSGVAVETKALVKIRKTLPQVGLSKEERRRNLKNAYAVQKPQAVQGRTVLLLDDVVTTGSTLMECARTLLAAGAKEVRALCLASA